MFSKDTPQGVHATLFGNVVLYRAFCPICQADAIVLNNHLQCCDIPVPAPRAIRFQRGGETEDRRRLPSRHQRRRILSQQQQRCLYCGLAFGSVIIRGIREILLRVEWDHLVPYSYSQNNSSANYAAACQVCNGIKSNRIFTDLYVAREYIRRIRAEKNYSD